MSLDGDIHVDARTEDTNDRGARFEMTFVFATAHSGATVIDSLVADWPRAKGREGATKRKEE